MVPHSHPLLGDALPPLSNTAEGVASDSEKQTILGRDGAVACVQHERKSSYSFPVPLLSVALISLAVVYLVLRCFDVTKGRSRVDPLRRSLAAADGRPCNGYEEGDKGGEGGEVAEWGAFGHGGSDGTSGERSAEGDIGRWVWHTRETLRWPSMPTTTATGGFGVTHGVRSVNGLHAAASTVGFQPAQSQDSRPVGSLWAQEVPGSESAVMGRHFKVAFQQRNETGHPAGGPGGMLREEEVLKMWEGRGLPPATQEQVVSLSQQMGAAVLMCQSLLPALTHSQRLRLALEVVRLLALQLGFFSLVQQHLEPFRSQLGYDLLQLVMKLRRGGDEEHLDAHRNSLRELVALVTQLREPRPYSERTSPSSYRVKVRSLLQTASEVVKLCLGVLAGLSQHVASKKYKESSDVITQQVRALRNLFEVHASYVARDSTLRYFIIESQKRIFQRPILCRRHADISSQPLPSMSQVVQEIHEAVLKDGDLLQSSSQPPRTPHGAATSPYPTAHQIHTSPTSYNSAGKEWGHTQQQDAIVQPSQRLSVAVGSGLQNLQATPVVAPPSHAPSLLSTGVYHSGSPFSLQPKFTTRHTHRPVQPFPSYFPKPLMNSSMPSMQPLPRGFSAAHLHRASRGAHAGALSRLKLHHVSGDAGVVGNYVNVGWRLT